MIRLACSGVTGLPSRSRSTYGFAAGQHRPGPLGQPGGHDTSGLGVVGAVGGHLPVVDRGKLRVLSGDLGGADELVAQP
jgi:hypothetical protein